jgi:hypothetical protein
MDALRNDSAGFAYRAFRKKRLNCLTDVKNAGLAHESLGSGSDNRLTSNIG